MRRHAKKKMRLHSMLGVMQRRSSNEKKGFLKIENRRKEMMPTSLDLEMSVSKHSKGIY